MNEEKKIVSKKPAKKEIDFSKKIGDLEEKLNKCLIKIDSLEKENSILSKRILKLEPSAAISVADYNKAANGKFNPMLAQL